MTKFILDSRYTRLKQIVMPVVSLVLAYQFSTAQQVDSLDEKINNALAFSEVQLDKLAQMKGDERFVAYTDTSGKWIGKRVTDWCCGFTPGLMWMMYDHTKDEKWAAYGREWTNAVRDRATAADNDTGFQIFCSYGYGLRHAAKPSGVVRLHEYDIKDWPGFILALRTGAKTEELIPGERVWELLPKKLQVELEKALLSDELKSRIIKALNDGVLSERAFYKEEYFTGIELEKSVQKLLRKQSKLSTSDTKKLNRALLEAGFPDLVRAVSTLSEVETRDYEGVVRWANETFTTQRYNAHVGAYRTWPPQLVDPYVGKFEVNSDMIMNLELPLYVAVKTKNYDLLDKVMRHQEATWQHTIFKSGDKQWAPESSSEYVERKHGSHWHVVDFDAVTGNVLHKRQYQGDRDESTWSRGQAWLIYGYAMLYRYTGQDLMLERAEVCFDYYMSALKAQSKDYIPYSDFDAPLIETHPLDTSAAAIVASAAVELYGFTEDKKYLDAARNMLNDLTSAPYLSKGTDFESILTRGSYKFDDEKEIGAIFGDFYFVEAMLRYKAMKVAE